MQRSKRKSSKIKRQNAQKKKRGCYSGAPLLSTYVILHVTALFGQNTTLHTLYLHSTYTHETSLSNFQISHGSKPMTLKTGLLAQFFTLNKKTPTKKANSSSFRSKKLKSLKPESAAPRRKRTALFYLKEKKGRRGGEGEYNDFHLCRVPKRFTPSRCVHVLQHRIVRLTQQTASPEPTIRPRSQILKN